MTPIPRSPFLDFVAELPLATEPASEADNCSLYSFTEAGPFQSALDPATGADSAAGPDLTDPPDPAADYIPELFSVFARRRCMPIISPPLRAEPREFEPDLDALFDAIVPPEPPPLFLRSPSQAFMRALFELSR